MTKKLASIIKELALSSLKDPHSLTSAEAACLVVMLANIAWNRENMGDETFGATMFDDVVEKFHSLDVSLCSAFLTSDCTQLLKSMREYKKQNYPDDKRIILTCGLNQDGSIQVSEAPAE